MFQLNADIPPAGCISNITPLAYFHLEEVTATTLFLLTMHLCRVLHRSRVQAWRRWHPLGRDRGIKTRLRWAGTGQEFKASSRKLLKAACTQKQAQPASKRSLSVLEDS